jgi:hypothetical protein
LEPAPSTTRDTAIAPVRKKMAADAPDPRRVDAPDAFAIFAFVLREGSPREEP